MLDMFVPRKLVSKFKCLEEKNILKSLVLSVERGNKPQEKIIKR